MSKCLAAKRTWLSEGWLLPTAQGPERDTVVATHRARRTDPVPRGGATPSGLAGFLEQTFGAAAQAS